MSEAEYLNRFIDIGFNLIKTNKTHLGEGFEYKYYSPYLVDKHFTLVLFKRYSGSTGDFRLYIHHNKDGSYNQSPFQCHYESNKIYLNNKFDEIFHIELKVIKREKILKEIL